MNGTPMCSRITGTLYYSYVMYTDARCERKRNVPAV